MHTHSREAGEAEAARVIARVRARLQEVPSMEIEYVEIVDAETLESIEQMSGRVLVAVAVRIGVARLIDNIVVDTGR